MSKHKTFGSDSEDDEETGLLGSSGDEDHLDDDDDDDVEEELLAGSDSDDAPEAVGFAESRQIVLDKVKDTLKQIQTDKQSVKDRRKKKEELFKQQKQQRLSSLAQSRLPEDFLEELPSEPIIKKKKLPEKSPGVSTIQEQADSDEVHDDSGNEDGEPEDYLPLTCGAGDMHAVSLPDFLKQPKSSEEKAADFREKLLYNSKIPRQSAQALKGSQAKRKARLK